MKKKKKVIIPISPVGILESIGYHSYSPKSTRRKKLVAYLKQHPKDYKAVILRLNATAIRLKNTKPDLMNNLRSDMAYLKQIFR